VSGGCLPGQSRYVFGRVSSRCEEEGDDHQVRHASRHQRVHGRVDRGGRGFLVCVRDQHLGAERGLERGGDLRDDGVRGGNPATVVDEEDGAHAHKVARPDDRRDACPVRRVAISLSLLALSLSAGCGPGESAADAGLDVSVPDAPESSDAGAPLDAPRRMDAGYDSGATCELAAGTDAGAIVACNGHPELCERRYDEVAVVMTHNAMSSEEEGFISPNQNRRLWRQLEDGAPGFMLDVHLARDGSVVLCHGLCALGQRPLADGLRDLRVFLDCHPHEVLTIIFESNVSEAQVAEGFTASGLDRYVYTPEGPPGAGVAWPTLREMIAGNERVVVFTADRDRTLPWHLYTYDWAWENPYAATTPEELSCAEDRGSRDRSLWVFNHFLTAPLASPALADSINHDPFFSERVDGCRMVAGGDLPNFVTVDFYDLGDVIAVVDALNGVTP